MSAFEKVVIRPFANWGRPPGYLDCELIRLQLIPWIGFGREGSGYSMI